MELQALQPVLKCPMTPELARAEPGPAAPGPHLVPAFITEAAPGSDGAGNPTGPSCC